ncbi:DUF2922 domain-containing protein [Anaerococcus sp. AGMB00486]|uniref:DUF2922 domain-containing protein n=2 Tax=Anaerococcus TaxID=165779 RepID=A0ABX2N8S5_9FIRM|nr:MULTISPECIES: DUF2922 domain-containing protein [Anaerococcus]MSS77430.1 DUF2922 domain-containing protein [Anaerococcus porci]NVF11089.1 DUF2922 domain-containing protein [Anaerococcus faecalis]
MENRKLKLGFKDDFNKSKTISVDYPKVDLNNQEIRTAMDKIIESKVIETKDGKISKVDKAYIERVSRDEINVNEII